MADWKILSWSILNLSILDCYHQSGHSVTLITLPRERKSCLLGENKVSVFVKILKKIRFPCCFWYGFVKSHRLIEKYSHDSVFTSRISPALSNFTASNFIVPLFYAHLDITFFILCASRLGDCPILECTRLLHLFFLLAARFKHLIFLVHHYSLSPSLFFPYIIYLFPKEFDSFTRKCSG